MENTTLDRPLISIHLLKKYFAIPHKGMLHAVDGINLDINSGKTVGLVGESGCGKSTVGNLLLGLLSPTEGEFLFKGNDVFKLNKIDKKQYYRKLQMIFQDPYSSLNPKKTIKQILGEAFISHRIAKKGKALDQKIEELCGIVDIPGEILNRHPHELDGGMRQVVGIARALSLKPDFIVCDEPVSSLDVSVQAKIINLLMDLQQKMQLTYLFVSHDLSVVRHISNRIAVMYLGQIVELAETNTIFENTLHPYSIALLSAVPKVNVDSKVSRIVLKGDVPSPMNPKPGCRFAPRCWMSEPSCFTETPPLREVEPGHQVACYRCDVSRENISAAEKTSLEGLGGE
jgi:oligopeptide/dipeptide ABC transporter ATP-binding protein